MDNIPSHDFDWSNGLGTDPRLEFPYADKISARPILRLWIP